MNLDHQLEKQKKRHERKARIGMAVDCMCVGAGIGAGLFLSGWVLFGMLRLIKFLALFV